MKRVVLGALMAFALTVPVPVLVSGAESAFAQQVRGDLESYQLAQGGFEIFVDERGRRFLFDPYTGEVVGRANRNAPFTRADKRSAERALRRASRRDRLNRELGGLFDIFPERDEQPEPRRRLRAQDGDNGFFLDERTKRRRQLEERVQPGVPTPPPPTISPVTPEEEVATLPGYHAPTDNAASASEMSKPNYDSNGMAELQVFLDREGFSPGVIDGQWGSNVAKAVAAWKEANRSSANLGDRVTLDQLFSTTGGDAFTTYTLTQADVAGPYLRHVPEDYSKKSKLETLGYASVFEMLGEKFHMSEAYLRKLNPGKNFNRAGTVIKVVAPGPVVTQKVHYIVADKGRKQVRGYDRNGKLVAAYPATIGSSETPSPTGTHSVERIAVNPEYTYNPKKNFQQGDNDKILRIPPGPNGPVGSVWIALSKPTYGIHGTPNPETIGKTNSHGCIRLTNWDALELVKLVSKGVTVEFIE